MKYFTVAVFLGLVSADALEEAMNALKIEVHNQDQIESEWNDVEQTFNKVKHTRPWRNLESSLKRWFESKEAMNIHRLDKAFYSSPEGKRLIAEWRDVGEVLDDHIYHNKTGIHIDNGAMPEIEDELDDVADQYEQLGKTHWAKKYDAAYKAFFTNEEHASVKRRAESFKNSRPGQALKKEMQEFKKSVHDNVEVSDIPEDWKKEQMDLKVEISKQGQMEIEKEINDVKRVKNDIKHSRPVRNFKSSVRRWAHSDEVEHLKELDRKFLASPEGKRLVAEWKDFGHALKSHIKKTENGIHIDNKAWDEIEDEAKDVEDQYKQLDGSKWDKAYEAGWKAATNNKEAHSVGRRW